MLRFCALVGLLLVSSSGYLSAQKQDWTSYRSRIDNYPSAVYFTGFMSGHLSKGDDLEKAKLDIIEQAKVQLSENIRISIESKITNKMTNVNSISLQEFEKVSQSYSHISVSGLKTDVFIDTRKKEIFAFTWVRKSEVIDHYSNLIQSQFQKIEEQFHLGSDLLRINQIKALRIFYSTKRLFREMEEAQTILVICGLDDTDTLLKAQTQNLKREIAKMTEVINSSKNLSLSELSAFLVASLKMQTGTLKEPIQVSNITYRDSKMSSAFSERFSSLLINDLTNEGFIVADFKGAPYQPKTGNFLSGSYWEEGQDGLQVVMALRKVEDDLNQAILAGEEGWTTIATLINSKLEYKPSNYFYAVEKGKLFSKNEIVNGGAKLEIWTNKGDEGLIYKEGDKLRLLIRMNKIGYIRLINHWADGTQVMLLDNYYIDYRKVNRVIKLPLEWEVTCPCGIEFVQANAQNVEFVPLDTKMKDGFNLITAETKEVIIKNRSYSEEALDTGGFAVEERLVIATID